MNKALDDVIATITESFEYKKCLELKEKMSNNSELVSLIDNVKKIQKKYIRSGYDDNLKIELEEEKEKLDHYPIYVSYLHYLDIVNEKISTVVESLNDYFDEVLNK